MADKAKKKRSIGWTISLCVLGVLIIAYIGVATYFENRFFPNTEVMGNDISFLTAEDAARIVDNTRLDYSLDVYERNDCYRNITDNEIGMKFDSKNVLEQKLDEQNGFLFFVPLLFNKGVKEENVFPIVYDYEKLDAVVDDMINGKFPERTAAKDAFIYYVPGICFVVQPEIRGNVLKEAETREAIIKAIDNMEEAIDCDELGLYIEPEILQDDEALLSSLEMANNYIKSHLDITIGSEKMTVDGKVLDGFLERDENNNPIMATNGQVSIDEEKVDAFVEEVYKHFTTASDKCLVRTSYNQDIRVGNRANYGFIVDKEAEKADLMRFLTAGKQLEESREPFFSQRADAWSKYEYGRDYVEINLSAQHLFVYQNGIKVFDTDFVSGSVRNGTVTRVGIFNITYKQTNATLRGPGYASFVYFWMPFDGGIGLHDATWRRKFGGQIYKTSGSHGCINLPLESARTIYNLVYAGEPVIVYELPGTETDEITDLSPKKKKDKDEKPDDKKKDDKKNDDKKKDDKKNNDSNDN